MPLRVGGERQLDPRSRAVLRHDDRAPEGGGPLERGVDIVDGHVEGGKARQTCRACRRPRTRRPSSPDPTSRSRPGCSCRATSQTAPRRTAGSSPRRDRRPRHGRCGCGFPSGSLLSRGPGGAPSQERRTAASGIDRGLVQPPCATRKTRPTVASGAHDGASRRRPRRVLARRACIRRAGDAESRSWLVLCTRRTDRAPRAVVTTFVLSTCAPRASG